MMRRYGQYKDSGVTWLGEVPAHWGVMPVKRDIAFITSGSRGWAENYADDGDLFIRIGNLTRDSIRLDLSDIQRVVVPDGAEGSRTQVQPGDVLFSITAYLGSVAVVPEGLGTAYVSQHVALVRPARQRLLPEWLAYVASSNVGKTYLETQGYGGTKIQLSLDDVSNLLVTVPTLAEQSMLTKFLDFETAKIDALVEEQKRLIELLKEKRQAVISQAVTKGLDPNAPMKDSGVRWLGRIPAHWDAVALKRISPAQTVGIVVNPSNYVASEGLPFIYGGDIREGRIDLVECRRISAEDSERNAKTRLRAGDLVTVRVGAPGVTAVVPQEADGGNCASVMLIRHGDFDSRWLCYTMNDRVVRFQVEVVQYGAAQEQFNISHAVEFILPRPSWNEQRLIADHLEKQTAKLDELVMEAEAGIQLLAERRAALISAAVTGKIDVRGLVPQTEAIAA